MSSVSKLTGWVRDGSLWSYHKPETREDRHARVIRENQELRRSWKERLADQHVCPDCGSNSYYETLMGWLPSEEHYHDSNRKQCTDCGREWWIVCPCGYSRGV